MSQKKCFKSLILAVILLIFSIGLKSEDFAFQDISLKKAVKMAKKQNKLVFILVGTDYCEDCKHIKEVLSLPKIQSVYSSKFISIKMNPDKMTNNIKLNNWGVSKIPTLIYYSPKKVELKSGTVVNSQIKKPKARYSNILYKSTGIQTEDSLSSHLLKLSI